MLDGEHSAEALFDWQEQTAMGQRSGVSPEGRVASGGLSA